MRSAARVSAVYGARVAVAAMLLALLPGRAAGQTTSDPNDPNATSSSNTVSVSTFEVSGGTPGSWIEAALSRHAAFVAARVNAARNGDRPGVQWSSSTTSTTTSSTTTDNSSSTLDSLSPLLSLYGSSSSSLGSLSSLLSSLTGTSSTTTTSTAESKSSATQESASSTTTTTDSTSDPETPFRIRLVSSLLDTFLNALALEFQSSDFVDFLKTLLEPLVLPPTSDQTSGTSTGG